MVYILQQQRNITYQNMINLFALEKMYRDNEGRLVVPLLWSSQVSHLLGHNY